MSLPSAFTRSSAHRGNTPARLVAAMLGFALLGAACTSSSDGDDLQAVTTASTQATTTTTEATTTTTEATTTTTLSDEEAVRLVHTRFMTELFVRNETTPDLNTDLLAELTTGAQLERTLEITARDAETGDYSRSPGYDSNITFIKIDDDQAYVLDCSQDRSVIYNANDEVLIPADDFFKIRETQLVKLDGHWLVENFLAGGDLRCDPEDLS